MNVCETQFDHTVGLTPTQTTVKSKMHVLLFLAELEEINRRCTVCECHGCLWGVVTTLSISAQNTNNANVTILTQY